MAQDEGRGSTTTAPADKPQTPGQPRAGATGVKPYKTLWNNFISMTGVFVVLISLILLLTFGLFSIISPAANPYVDIVGYLIIPSILVFGLIITPIGILIKSWRLRRKNPREHLSFRFPHFDLNDPLQRRAVKIVGVLTFIMLPVLGVSGYHGYHYTDSVQFCAQACHSVMKPQATSYKHSAHARVACAECHIGAGASWFVKSKLSGTRQVFATLRNTYPRPIPPAITNLRPARETCERCHWPQKFYGAQLRRIVNYAADETNTRQEIDMLLKIGGGDESAGPAEGIHKHMALEGRIEYIATDDKLQEIPWVKYTDNAGNELIYRSDGLPTSDPIPEGRLRNLDCMDCHNRPAHNFKPPERAVDVYLEVGRIDRTLPFIKREAVAILIQPQPDTETADARIGKHLTDFYEENFPEIWENRRAAVNQAIDEVRDIYNKNFFPDMKVDWRTYPDNIGHKNFAGCFRCHGGKHVNQHGELISHECKVCHTFLNPVDSDSSARVIQEGEFVHPMELQGVHAALLCYQCHTGGRAPVTTCEGCHSSQHEFRAGTLAALSPYGIEPSPMFGMVGCEDCHDIEEPVSLAAVDEMCMDCHEDEPEVYEGMLASWAQSVEQHRAKADAAIEALLTWIGENRQVTADIEEQVQWSQVRVNALRALSTAGPLHNHAAAVMIYDRIATEAAGRLQTLTAQVAETP